MSLEGVIALSGGIVLFNSVVEAEMMMQRSIGEAIALSGTLSGTCARCKCRLRSTRQPSRQTRSAQHEGLQRQHKG